MQFTTFLKNGQSRLGVVQGKYVIDLNAALPHVPADLRSALELNIDFPRELNEALSTNALHLEMENLQFAPLIGEPGKIVCLGLNYFDHAKEGGRDKPDYPWFFYRGKSSLLGHKQGAVLPKVSEKFDYEAELAVVIGSQVPRHTKAPDALQFVLGYTTFNDMSVRDFQKKTPQWTIGKNFDKTGGFGPILTTADELPPGAMNLKIQCRLNGVVMQQANTSDMIFSVAETIELLAQCMTLEPGDVIAMGTPAGVGQARTPPVWMKAGDVIDVEIDGIGLLSNTIVDEEAESA
jgi:acylpyruvate hydrolase